MYMTFDLIRIEKIRSKVICVHWGESLGTRLGVSGEYDLQLTVLINEGVTIVTSLKQLCDWSKT